MNEYYNRVIEWNKVHGLGYIDRQQKITQAEWQEWHDSNHKDLWELADVFFTSAYLHYLIEQAEKEHHSSYIEALREVEAHNAWPYVDAVIKSNYTKYIEVASLERHKAVEEAVKIERDSNGRYTNVVCQQGNGYWYFLGNEPKTGTIGKVLKPSWYKDAKELLPLGMSH